MKPWSECTHLIPGSHEGTSSEVLNVWTMNSRRNCFYCRPVHIDQYRTDPLLSRVRQQGIERKHAVLDFKIILVLLPLSSLNVLLTLLIQNLFIFYTNVQAKNKNE